jgi:hypothetical protein
MIRQFGYGLLCVAALLYLAGANARGYVPFAGPPSRAATGYGHSGGGFFFHK